MDYRNRIPLQGSLPMVHDYAKHAPSRTRRIGQKIVMLVVMLAAVAAIILFYDRLLKSQIHRASHTPLIPPPVSRPSTHIKPTTEFDFYRMLPTMEVDIPPEASTTPTPTHALSSTDRYLLQVASFQSTGEAEHLKSQLIALGHKTVITSYRAPDGTLWTRVLTGPYISLTEAAQAQTRLHQQKMNSVLLKNK